MVCNYNSTMVCLEKVIAQLIHTALPCHSKVRLLIILLHVSHIEWHFLNFSNTHIHVSSWSLFRWVYETVWVFFVLRD